MCSIATFNADSKSHDFQTVYIERMERLPPRNANWIKQLTDGESMAFGKSVLGGVEKLFPLFRAAVIQTTFRTVAIHQPGRKNEKIK